MYQTISKIVCINMYESQDRYEYQKKQFKEYDLPVDFYRIHRSCKGGKWGCNESHWNIIKEAYNRDLKNIMIFEDDVKLHASFYYHLYKAIEVIENTDYDVINLGGYPLYYYKNYNSYFYLGISSNSNCYIISRNGIKKFITMYPKPNGFHADDMIFYKMENQYITPHYYFCKQDIKNFPSTNIWSELHVTTNQQINIFIQERFATEIRENMQKPLLILLYLPYKLRPWLLPYFLLGDKELYTMAWNIKHRVYLFGGIIFYTLFFYTLFSIEKPKEVTNFIVLKTLIFS